ncbi:diphthine synthase [Candidatus Woesearchaeota archaeon]|nr:diphthine synthase [Candidatus Woesearchaeota archaeon]
MTLYFIGLGLNDEKDISIKGLETIKRCKYIYLENYTSILKCSKESLEKFYSKEIIPADRDLVEKQAETTILKHAKEADTAFLVIGDPMCATTHTDLFLRAKKAGIETKVIHNASIISAIGITGLEVYKFGKTTSIPFENENIKAPYDALINNLDKGLHTLFLLDLKPNKNEFLTIKQAIEYLEKQGLIPETKLIACARIGSDSPVIKYGTPAQLKEIQYGSAPYCLIIPAKLHFVEEEFLEQYKI